MRTSLPSPTSAERQSRPRRARWLVAIVAVLGLGLTACTDGPGNEQDLVIALTHNDAFTTDQAECIAASVFGEYGDDEEAISRISGAPSYEDLTDATTGIPGFDEFFRRAVSTCTNT